MIHKRPSFRHEVFSNKRMVTVLLVLPFEVSLATTSAARSRREVAVVLAASMIANKSAPMTTNTAVSITSVLARFSAPDTASMMSIIAFGAARAHFLARGFADAHRCKNRKLV